IDRKEECLLLAMEKVKEAQEELQECVQTNQSKLQSLEKLETKIQEKRTKLLESFSVEYAIPVETLLKLVHPETYTNALSELTIATQTFTSIELAIQAAKEELASFEDDLEKIDVELNQAIDEEKRTSAEAEQAQKELTNAETLVQRENTELQNLRSQEDVYKARLAEVTTALNATANECTRRQKAAVKLRTELDKLQTERASLLGNYLKMIPREEREHISENFDDYVTAPVDYSVLPKEILSPVAVEKFCAAEESKIAELHIQIFECHVGKSDPTALARHEKRYKAVETRLKALMKRAAEQKNVANGLVKRRADIFSTFIDNLQKTVNPIYGELSGGGEMTILHGVGADPARPFDGGVVLDCRPRGEQFTRFANLSGGQKNQASLAFLLAMHAIMGLPFLLMDEPDASLSDRHCESLALYVHNQQQQVVIVSHRSMTLNRPAYRELQYSLVGVTKVQTTAADDDTRIFHVSVDRVFDRLKAQKALPILGTLLSDEQQSALDSAYEEADSESDKDMELFGNAAELNIAEEMRRGVVGTSQAE
ncbi:chromosome segregation protein SMC-like, partial [Tropilaelaps mercedesae]